MMHSAWRCVLIGSESLLIQCAKILEGRGHQIAAVVSHSAPIQDWARQSGIPLIDRPQDMMRGDIGPFQYLFSITNLTILSDEILNLPSEGAINFHDGPLPGYAGLNAPCWALLNGELRHGVTWHRMTRQVDAGDILATREIAVDEGETAFSLNTKCFAAAIEAFEELVDALQAGQTAPSPQRNGPRRLFTRRDRPAAACAIQWDQPAERISQLVRALDFGAYANPMGVAKASFSGSLMLVQSAVVAESGTNHLPGTIVRIGVDEIIVATGARDISLRRLSTMHGATLTIGDAVAQFGLAPGLRFDLFPTDTLTALSEICSGLAVHEDHWRRRLAALSPIDLPLVDRGRHPGRSAWTHADAAMADPDVPNRAKTIFAAVIAYLGRIIDKPEFDIGYTDPVLTARYGGLEPWFSPQIPLHAKIDFAAGLDALQEQLGATWREAHRHMGFSADLAARMPELRATNAGDPTMLPVSVQIVDQLEEIAPLPGSDLTVAIRSDGRICRWLYDSASLDYAAVQAMQEGLAVLLSAADAQPRRPVGDLPLLSPADQARLEQQWRGPAVSWRDSACIHELFTEQASRTPDCIAITCRNESLTYRELDQRSNQFAHRLTALGVGPDVLVGLYVERSVDMLVALFGIQKAGGAYVPLDPKYPADRIGHMVADSRAHVIVTQAHLAECLPANDATIVRIDADWPLIAQYSTEPVKSGVGPANLAYVIYTSGSTGKPKGVMVEHRNVANFFAGMDQQIAPAGTWLAVTSLSFDISVLELCWPLARGFHVVLATGGELTATSGPALRPVDFSLFYFAADADNEPGDKYRLLLEGAKFADENGFAAVWTPERHFHAFGGLYPNPAVTGAAIAAITSRIQIRGGSVVAPLHHPARVAEEWSVVDNISNGRVGIAFASGWQPNDFVLRPESYADRSSGTLRDMDIVRALWRGESRAFAGPLGNPVEVRILPRPIQPELPFWITSAGNAETFAAAGRSGAGILTHLLGQTVEELAEKLAIYRRARKEAGHSGDGHVTLMLHTFVGPDADQVREKIREPMIAYLRTSTSLVKQYAWSFPAFKRRSGMVDSEGQSALEALSQADMEALLSYAFDRYYETSGLFGTPRSCMEMVERVRAAGVDEIASLVDFGAPTAEVLAHLPYLNQLRQLASATVHADEPLPALMERHGVTHLQCTPSTIRLILAQENARSAFSALQHLMIGGEAFPPALAAELESLVSGTVSNMYGPTETTIWSATHKLDGAKGAVPLGTPLANQNIQILDSRQKPLPPGVPGEIVIGGNGVVRGYLERPDLTAERFIADPMHPVRRAYRTGDLGRCRADGVIEFLGRLDHQVKVRGYRIELGEIEAALSNHRQVREAAVIACEDESGDKRLLAYLAPALSSDAMGEIREFLRSKLPDFMIPAQFVGLEHLPRTPNGKIDRNALPAPDQAKETLSTEPFVAPSDGIEERIAAIWRDVLKLDRVGTRDNFFDLGGHSLLAVQLHHRLRTELLRELPITDIFRFPTVQSLSAHLSGEQAADQAAREGQSRAQGRRAALHRRIARREPATMNDGS